MSTPISEPCCWSNLKPSCALFAVKMRNWSPYARAKYFNDYLQHPLILTEAGPASVQAARSFLENSYTALASAAWRWPADFGNTDITQAQMNNFVSEELFSVRHYVGSKPQTIPQGFAEPPGRRGTSTA